MYTAGRPPTPALIPTTCIPQLNETFKIFDEAEVEINEEERCCEKVSEKSGRLLIGRWGRVRRSESWPEPPEVVVQQARLHDRPPKTPAPPPRQQNVKRPRQKDSKKSDKKFIKETFKSMKTDEESVRNDGRMIASKVLPIMAMLLQKSEEEEEGEKATPPEPTKKAQGPRLAVQCIQLLPSEPNTNRRNS